MIVCLVGKNIDKALKNNIIPKILCDQLVTVVRQKAPDPNMIELKIRIFLLRNLSDNNPDGTITIVATTPPVKSTKLISETVAPKLSRKRGKSGETRLEDREIETLMKNKTLRFRFHLNI